MQDPDHIVSLSPVANKTPSKTKTVIYSILISLAAFGVLTVGYLMNSSGLGFSTRATLNPVDVNILPAQTGISQNENVTINIFIAPNDNNISTINAVLKFDPALLTPILYEPNQLNASINLQSDGQFILTFDANCQACTTISDSQNLYTVIFQSTGQSGSAAIDFAESDLNIADSSGNLLRTNISEANIQIQ